MVGVKENQEGERGEEKVWQGVAGWAGHRMMPEGATVRKNQTQESGDSYSVSGQDDQSRGSRGGKDPGGGLEAEERGTC